MTSAAPLSPATSRVKFHIAGDAQPLLLLPVHVNGRGPFEFVFDTGASTTLLTPDLAAELEIKSTGAKQGMTAGGRVGVQLGTVESLRLGEAQRDKVDIAITDLSAISRAIGTNLDGDLGYNFLRHFRLTIDFRAQELKLEDPHRIESFGDASATEVPMRLAQPSKPLILVDAQVGERGPFQFAIDTGTSTTAISPELSRTLGLQTKSAGNVTTGGAAISLQAARVRSLRIGRSELRDVDVLVGDFLEMLSQAAGAKLDGIVGYNFLRHYKVIIDYPNESFRLE
jgi:predicted aspartyl protease